METLFTPASDPYQGCEIASVDEMNPVWRDIFFSTQSTLVLPMMLQGKAQISPLLRGGTETANCLPVLDGKQISIYGFEESFIRGFSRMYDRLLRDRDALAKMVRRAEDMSARFVLRASAYYALTLHELHSPAGCASAEAREGILADLNRHFEKEPAYLPVVQWERACLEEGDIPYFSFRAGQSGLYGDPRGDILLKGFFQMPAIERCLLTLEHSGPEEKRFELDYLRRRFLQGPDSAKGPVGGQPEEIFDPLSPQDARAEAVKILHQMDGMALRLTNGERILLSADKHLVPSHHPNFERGLPGMSLFFDLFQKCPGLNCAETASRLLRDTEADLLRSRRTYRQMTQTFRGILHPGLRKGVGGLLLSPCLDRAGVADVLDSLMLMTRSFDEEDASLYAGIGGLLAGCLAAASRIGDGEEKEMLSRLIERLSCLLMTRTESAGQVSGLGRGMAGTGLALVQAWKYTGDRTLTEAAGKAFALESGQYRDLLRGWPDYGKSPLPVILGESLEAGAPGIALAAVLCEQTVPAAGELADRALPCTLALPFQETDDLALGNAGIALALTEAACRRRDPDLLRAAGERLALSAKRADRDGGYRSVPLRLRNIPDPSFWRGNAGIGYAMLKYAEACEKIQGL
jgi:lantibiotic modifying enzyme